MLLFQDITHFPHAVLEVKLSLPAGIAAPDWVDDLIASDMLTEVNKFSKFLHGSAVLLPTRGHVLDELPYWMDDASIQPSIKRSRNDRRASAVGGKEAAGGEGKAAKGPKKRGGKKGKKGGKGGGDAGVMMVERGGNNDDTDEEEKSFLANGGGGNGHASASARAAAV